MQCAGARSRALHHPRRRGSLPAWPFFTRQWTCSSPPAIAASVSRSDRCWWPGAGFSVRGGPPPARVCPTVFHGRCRRLLVTAWPQVLAASPLTSTALRRQNTPCRFFGLGPRWGPRAFLPAFENATVQRIRRAVWHERTVIIAYQPYEWERKGRKRRKECPLRPPTRVRVVDATAKILSPLFPTPPKLLDPPRIPRKGPGACR